MYDTPQSKGMIDGDTIIVELLITGDANRLAHLAVEKLKDIVSWYPGSYNPCFGLDHYFALLLSYPQWVLLL